jgi:hypothetical protein
MWVALMAFGWGAASILQAATVNCSYWVESIVRECSAGGVAPTLVVMFSLHNVKLDERQDTGEPDEEPEKIVKAEVK